jgi:hypothetical protein
LAFGVTPPPYAAFEEPQERGDVVVVLIVLLFLTSTSTEGENGQEEHKICTTEAPQNRITRKDQSGSSLALALATQLSPPDAIVEPFHMHEQFRLLSLGC